MHVNSESAHAATALNGCANGPAAAQVQSTETDMQAVASAETGPATGNCRPATSPPVVGPAMTIPIATPVTAPATAAALPPTARDLPSVSDAPVTTMSTDGAAPPVAAPAAVVAGGDVAPTLPSALPCAGAAVPTAEDVPPTAGGAALIPPPMPPMLTAEAALPTAAVVAAGDVCCAAGGVATAGPALPTAGGVLTAVAQPNAWAAAFGGQGNAVLQNIVNNFGGCLRMDIDEHVTRSVADPGRQVRPSLLANVPTLPFSAPLTSVAGPAASPAINGPSAYPPPSTTPHDSVLRMIWDRTVNAFCGVPEAPPSAPAPPTRASSSPGISQKIDLERLIRMNAEGFPTQVDPDQLLPSPPAFSAVTPCDFLDHGDVEMFGLTAVAPCTGPSRRESGQALQQGLPVCVCLSAGLGLRSALHSTRVPAVNPGPKNKNMPQTKNRPKNKNHLGLSTERAKKKEPPWTQARQKRGTLKIFLCISYLRK